ncbi:hypothetical protein [Algoriphagus boritolerans]
MAYIRTSLYFFGFRYGII